LTIYLTETRCVVTQEFQVEESANLAAGDERAELPCRVEHGRAEIMSTLLTLAE